MSLMRICLLASGENTVKSLVEVVFVLKAWLEVREKLKYLKMHENYDITLVC